MRHLPFLFASFALVACGAGGELDDRFDPGVPVSAVPTSAEAPAYFLAIRGASTTVVAVHADTGAVVPFGPELPLPPSEVASIVYATEGRVIVQGEDWNVDGAGIVWVGDGATWKELARGAGWPNATTSDGSGIVLSRSCNEALDTPATFTFSVLDIDGAGSWRTLDCPVGDSPTGIARGPNGKYLVVNRESGLFVRAPDGTETAVNAPSTAQPLALFDNSFLATWDGHAAWFDTTGMPLSVPGTATDPKSFGVAASFQVTAGALSAIDDGKVERLQALPPSIAASDIGAIVPGHYAVAMQGPKALVIGLDGATLETFDPGAPYDVGGVLAYAPPSAPWPWMVILSRHFTPTLADDVGDFEDLHTLYLPGDPASGKPARSRVLAHDSPDGLLRTYWPSSSGRFVLYQDGNALHAIEIETQNDVTLGGDYDAIFR